MSDNQNRLDVWIHIVADPHAKLRKFSILGKEFKCEGTEPFRGEMQDFTGKTMQGEFWVVTEDEVFRACPELKRLGTYGKPWFFPKEFCRAFFRPYYFRRSKIIEMRLTPPDEPLVKKPSGLIL